EQALTRRLVLDVAEILAQHRTVDRFYMSRQNCQGGGKFVAKLRQRHAGGFADFGKTNLLDALGGEQIQKCGNDLVAIARRRGGRAATGGSSRRSASGPASHDDTPTSSPG